VGWCSYCVVGIIWTHCYLLICTSSLRSKYLVTCASYQALIKLRDNIDDKNFLCTYLFMYVKCFGCQEHRLPISILVSFGWPIVGSHRLHISYTMVVTGQRSLGRKMRCVPESWVHVEPRFTGNGSSEMPNRVSAAFPEVPLDCP